MNSFEPEKLVKAALQEDMPHGDVTTDSLNLGDKIGRAKLIAKEDLVLSGADMFGLTFQTLDDTVKLTWQFRDGDFVFKGQTICVLQGSLAALLKGERTALNFLGRMSGVATLTRCFADQVKNTSTKILDTRKTTPGLRALEKRAVLHGGGKNHRFGLSDAVLIKENHIHAVGGIAQAVALTRKSFKGHVEIEVRNLEELQQAITARVDRVLLDNMSDELLAEAVRQTPAAIATEASGNMTLERVARVAATGVNFISVGALTHSAPCADVSLLFES